MKDDIALSFEFFFLLSSTHLSKPDYEIRFFMSHVYLRVKIQISYLISKIVVTGNL